MAVSALIGAKARRISKRLCRAITADAVADLEAGCTTRQTKDAISVIRSACMACGRCKGV